MEGDIPADGFDLLKQSSGRTVPVVDIAKREFAADGAKTLNALVQSEEPILGELPILTLKASQAVSDG